MIPIDGSYLYRLGRAYQKLESVEAGMSLMDAYLNLSDIKQALDELVDHSVYAGSVRLTREPAAELSRLIDDLLRPLLTERGNSKVPVDRFRLAELERSAAKFEAIFSAEFRQGHTYLVTPKKGYDLAIMTQAGEVLFPSTLGEYVPDAINDVREAAKCLAFELFTASGFHLHRANESVLLQYMKGIKYDKPIPEKRSMGGYISWLEEAKAPEAILSCLRDLKNMHRNPLMHPDESIDTLDDAVALLNSVYVAMTEMLRGLAAASQTSDDAGSVSEIGSLTGS